MASVPIPYFNISGCDSLCFSIPERGGVSRESASASPPRIRLLFLSGILFIPLPFVRIFDNSPYLPECYFVYIKLVERASGLLKPHCGTVAASPI